MQDPLLFQSASSALFGLWWSICWRSTAWRRHETEKRSYIHRPFRYKLRLASLGYLENSTILWSVCKSEWRKNWRKVLTLKSNIIFPIQTFRSANNMCVPYLSLWLGGGGGGGGDGGGGGGGGGGGSSGAPLGLWNPYPAPSSCILQPYQSWTSKIPTLTQIRYLPKTPSSYHWSVSR